MSGSLTVSFSEPLLASTMPLPARQADEPPRWNPGNPRGNQLKYKHKKQFRHQQENTLPHFSQTQTIGGVSQASSVRGLMKGHKTSKSAGNVSQVQHTAKSAARDKSVQNRLTCYRNVTHANKPAFLSSKLIQGKVDHNVAGAKQNAFSFTWRKAAPKPLSREMTPEFEELSEQNRNISFGMFQMFLIFSDFKNLWQPSILIV